VKFILINILTIFFLNTTSIHAQKLVVNKSAGNEIKFFAEATFNNFQGVTKAVDGYVVFNGDSKKDENVFDLKVALDSINTGIGLRNKHMRGYLNTDKNPYAEFKGDTIIRDSLSVSEYNLEAKGNFTVNGISKEITVPAKFYDFGELKKIKADFELKLSDFNIERPSFLFNKVRDEIKLELIIYLKKQE
jgi:polyisoprenoid-binding protein YceI